MIDSIYRSRLKMFRAVFIAFLISFFGTIICALPLINGTRHIWISQLSLAINFSCIVLHTVRIKSILSSTGYRYYIIKTNKQTGQTLFGVKIL